jgi:1-deoxy-D-xylulose-5-phosphate synthase
MRAGQAYITRCLEKGLHALDFSELQKLADAARAFLIKSVLDTGGHFSANLGVVELTVVLHHLLDLDTDRLIWDVGHQAYPHKLLSGRMAQFESLRQFGGMSGFPKRDEHPHDHFGTGHSSTSISAILGMAEAAKIKKDNRNHVAVIGDGSLTAGLAFEALNNLASSEANVLVIINDNRMGIDPVHGGMDNALNSDLIESWFEAFKLPYHGPVDGHNLEDLLGSVRTELSAKGPRILHVKTVKGKGYPPAEQEQTKWHSVKYVKVPSDAEEKERPSFPSVVGQQLYQVVEQEENAVVITPAMPSGSKLTAIQRDFPERFFDVGIAEQHAVTFSAGLASDGMLPFCVIYSTFLQRAYDQVIHDVCLQDLPVTFMIDRGGVVGSDGATHHGIFDLSMLKSVPNLTVYCPYSKESMEAIIQQRLTHKEGAWAIRYPKSEVPKSLKEPLESIQDWVQIPNPPTTYPTGDEEKTAVITIGPVLENVLELNPKSVDIYALLRVAPLPELTFLSDYSRIVVIEDGVKSGGIGESIAAQWSKIEPPSSHIGIINEWQQSRSFTHIGYPSEVIQHGSIRELHEYYGLAGEKLRSQL